MTEDEITEKLNKCLPFITEFVGFLLYKEGLFAKEMKLEVASLQEEKTKGVKGLRGPALGKIR